MYRLINAENIHNKHPDTFYIPPIEQRMALTLGTRAKVMFNSERIWIIVTQVKSAGHYIGTLENEPLSQRLSELHYGSEIEFESKHIIEIY